MTRVTTELLLLRFPLDRCASGVINKRLMDKISDSVHATKIVQYRAESKASDVVEHGASSVSIGNYIWLLS